jgi:hypothetical protein
MAHQQDYDDIEDNDVEWVGHPLPARITGRMADITLCGATRHNVFALLAAACLAALAGLWCVDSGGAPSSIALLCLGCVATAYAATVVAFSRLTLSDRGFRYSYPWHPTHEYRWGEVRTISAIPRSGWGYYSAQPQIAIRLVESVPRPAIASCCRRMLDLVCAAVCALGGTGGGVRVNNQPQISITTRTQLRTGGWAERRVQYDLAIKGVSLTGSLAAQDFDCFRACASQMRLLRDQARVEAQTNTPNPSAPG